LNKRILILGSPGAGKSYFSNYLSERIDVEVFHLDDYYWKENWEHCSDIEWYQTLRKILEKENFIMDGNYVDSIPYRVSAVNTIIYIDTGMILCLIRYTKRTLVNLVANGIYLPRKIRDQKYKKLSEKGYFEFCMYIIKFHLKSKKKLIFWVRQLADKNVFVLTPKEIKVILRGKGSANDTDLFR
jgi:hypothetical protein